MYEHKEKSAVGIAVPATENERINNTNIAQVSKKSKPVLAKNQRMTIAEIYKHSKNALELVDKLSNLEFCDLRTAADVLVESGFITADDKEYLTGQHIFMYIRKYQEEKQ